MGLPLEVLFLAVVVVPACVAVFFGLFSGKYVPPAVYLCRRCGHEFRRPAWKPFPARCPGCRARDWNAPGA